MEKWSKRCDVAGFEDGRKGLRAKECRRPVEAGNGEKHSLLQPPEECYPADNVILTQ